MRPVACLVPVRGLARGKQRLAPLLTEAERAALVAAMLHDVLDTLHRCARVTLLAVVSGDPEVAAVAAEYGALLLPDLPDGGLNACLQSGCAWLAAACPDHAVLLVPADLPALTPSLLEATVLAANAEVVIARAADGGTNLLLQQPPATLPLRFGPASAARHHEAARAAGRSVAVIDHPVLACDLDRPADLAAFLARPGAGRTLHLLHRLRLRERLAALPDVCAPGVSR